MNGPHVHGCQLDPDHRGGCLSPTPHQFGPAGCEHCTPPASDRKPEYRVAPSGFGGWAVVRQTVDPASGQYKVGRVRVFATEPEALAMVDQLGNAATN